MPRKKFNLKEETRFRIQKVIDAVDGRILGLNGQIPADPPVEGTPAAEAVAVLQAKREMAQELKELLLAEFHDDLVP
jgi:hypothetical protein